MKTYRDWPQIQDPQMPTVGNPIESKDTRLWGQLFFVVWGSKSFVDTLLLRLNTSDRKHSTRHNKYFAVLEYLALNVDSRGEKKGIDSLDTESRKLAPNSRNQVEFREITLYQSISWVCVAHSLL